MYQSDPLPDSLPNTDKDTQNEERQSQIFPLNERNENKQQSYKAVPYFCSPIGHPQFNALRSVQHTQPQNPAFSVIQQAPSCEPSQ